MMRISRTEISRFVHLLISAFLFFCFAECVSASAKNAVRTQKIEHARISGKLVIEINHGDFPYMALSPDGKFLAYVSVTMRNRREFSEVFICNLATRETFRLLNSTQARRYAANAVLIDGLRWPRPNRLEIDYSDGDVAGARLIFNPLKKTLTDNEFIETGMPVLSPELQKIQPEAVKLFPELSADVFEKASSWGSPLIALPGKGLLQGNNEGIWFFDFQAKVKRNLLDLSPFRDISLQGGAFLGDSVIFLVADLMQSWLYEYHNGVTKNINTNTLAHRGASGFWYLKQSTDQRLIRLLSRDISPVQAVNPLFIFDGKKLVQSNDFARLYDVIIDSQGKRIAFCYWQKDRRHISVRELK